MSFAAPSPAVTRPLCGTQVNSKDKYCYYAFQAPCSSCTCDPCLCVSPNRITTTTTEEGSVVVMATEKSKEPLSCCSGCLCGNVVVPFAVTHMKIHEETSSKEKWAKQLRQVVTEAIETPAIHANAECFLGFEVSTVGDRIRIELTPTKDWDIFLGLLITSMKERGYLFEPDVANASDLSRRKGPLRKIKLTPSTLPLENDVKGNNDGKTSIDSTALAVDIKEEEWRAVIRVEGMTCASCVANIEQNISKNAAVSKVAVNLLGEKAAVYYNPRLMTAEEIAESIEDMGYSTVVIEVRRESDAKEGDAESGVIANITLNIIGMTCASCVNNIEETAKKVNGILDVKVNLLTGTGRIAYDQDKIGIRKVLEVIDDMGYDVSVSTGGSARADEERERKLKEIRVWQWRLTAGVLFSIPIFVIAMILPKAAFDGVFQHTVYNELTVEMLVLFVLDTPVQFWVGWVFYRGAYHALKRRQANMDVLVALGTTAAYGYSVLACVLAMNNQLPETMTFFDAAAMIVTFICLGKYLEHLTKGQTTVALTTLVNLQAKSAVLVEGFDSGISNETDVPIEHVQRGDVLKVYPGAKIPTDGIVVSGKSAVDEALVTGESLPVTKECADEVVGGSINTVGVLYIRATKVGSDTMLSRVTRMVEDAQTNKAPIEDLTDLVAGRFVPIIVAVALLTLITWVILGYYVIAPSSIPHGFTPFLLAFNFFISVLVIACPCSLGLATPTAVMVGTGLGARYGVLIKGAKTLETAHRLNTVLFDKTGTLTYGKPDVTVFKLYQGAQKEEVLVAMAAAQSNSEHPLGKALFQYCVNELPKNQIFGTCDAFTAEPGKGLICTVTIPITKTRMGTSSDTRTIQVVAGNRRWMSENNIDPSAAESAMVKLEEQGITATLFGILGEKEGEAGTLWCLTGIADMLRPDSILVVQELLNRGIEPWMVTGDHRRTALAIAQQVGIRKVFAEVLPGEKGEKVAELQSEGLVVAMVGDGVNDSVALAQADVGIAMGAGSDVAIETADIVLVKSDILDVVTAIDISRTTFRRIIMNLIWAFAYNIIAVPFAAGILFPLGVMLPAWVCAGAMAASSVTVVCSSLLLNWYKPPLITYNHTNIRKTSRKYSSSHESLLNTSNAKYGAV
eukprot:CFRG7680T1